MTKVDFKIINIGTLSMNKFWHESERKRSPSSTCVLLETGNKRIIVDPSPAPDILEQLLCANAGITPADVDGVFLTHFHGDHRFGLDLFPGVPWLMASEGIEEWKQRSSEDKTLIDRFLPAGEHLPEGIDLLPSPGHTAAHHSLIVTTLWGRLVVSGDAVMTREFFEAGEGFHNSADPLQVRATIRKIRELADLIVPGHGNYFPNPGS